MAQQADIVEVRDALGTFLRDEMLAPGLAFDAATPLASLGIDSMALVQILLFVERRFGVEIPDAELTRANTATLEALSRCVERTIERGAPTLPPA